MANNDEGWKLPTASKGGRQVNHKPAIKLTFELLVELYKRGIKSFYRDGVPGFISFIDEANPSPMGLHWKKAGTDEKPTSVYVGSLEVFIPQDTSYTIDYGDVG